MSQSKLTGIRKSFIVILEVLITTGMKGGEAVLKDIIKMQSQSRSDFDKSSICSIQREIIEEATTPLIHQMSRFLLINEGHGYLTLQGKQYELKPGTLVSILPWQTSDVIQVDEPLKYYLMKYYFDGANNIIKSYYNTTNEHININGDITKRPVIWLDDEQLKNMNRLFSDIRYEQKKKQMNDNGYDKGLSDIYLMNKVVEIIIQFIRLGTLNNPDEKMIQSVIDNSEIIQYIYNHLSEKITLKRLSGIFYQSESSISNYINQTTGLSFFDLINEMRIGKTANFLIYTDLTMDELAEILGFVDSAHISKVFNSRIGMKANEYRKTYQKVNDICKIKETKTSFEMIDYIYRNSSEELTPKSVADKFGMTVKNLNKILMYQVEKNYEDFLNFIRINRASELLLSTDMTITQIAIEVGYNNSKTLNRNFLKFRLKTPGVFRQTVELQKSDIENNNI